MPHLDLQSHEGPGGSIPIGSGGDAASRSREDQLAKECRQRGGRWDSRTKTCEELETKPTPSEILADVKARREREEARIEKTARQKKAGLAFQGEIERGLTKRFGEDVPKGRVPLERAKEDIRRGIGEREEEIKREEEIEATRPEIEALARTIAEMTFTGDVEIDRVQIEQAIKSGLAGVLPGLGVGLVTAGLATVGTSGAAAPFTPIIIGLGAFSGFVAGFRGNLKAQRKDMIKGEKLNLQDSSQNLLKIVMNTNKGGDAVTMVDFFNEQLSVIDESHAKLQSITSDDLKNWLGEDGHPQLEKFENFYSKGGLREILVSFMNEAVLNPDPNKDLMGIQDLIAKED